MTAAVLNKVVIRSSWQWYGEEFLDEIYIGRLNLYRQRTKKYMHLFEECDT